MTETESVSLRSAGLAAGSVRIFVGAIWVFSGSVALFDCANAIRATYPSPGGHFEVVVFNRECGATTGFNVMASIVGDGDDLDDATDFFFAADTDHGGDPAASIRVAWRGPTEVVISHPFGLRLFRAEKVKRGVAIEYDGFERARSVEQRFDLF